MNVNLDISSLQQKEEQILSLIWRAHKKTDMTYAMSVSKQLINLRMVS